MAQAIYSLCALTALLCAGLLLRAYARTRFRLLLWSGLCFVGLTANNVLLVLDRMVFRDADLGLARLLLALGSVLLLVVGMLLEHDT